MQYNIFKVQNKNGLIDEMIKKGFEKIGNEIVSSNYKLNLFYRYDDDLKLTWNNILSIFGATTTPKRTGISGIIMCESNKNSYAITYGSSSFLVQKYSDQEFGFNFAKRIELKEMKRKSSLAPHSNRNSSIVSYKNTKTILFDTGENITSISFSPEDKFYGKRIDIGKSIKVKVNIPLSEISTLFEKIEQDMSKNIINKIPLLTRITNDEDVEKYNQIMYDTLENECNTFYNINKSQFSVNEFYIVGSSIYFEEEHTQTVKIGNYEEELELHNIGDLFELSKKSGINIKEILENGKIIYKDEDNKSIYRENIRKYINFEIETEKVSLYEDEWYAYNNDYFELVLNEVKTIIVDYNKEDNYTKKEIEKNKKEKNEYREEILNKMLSKKYNGTLLDRNLSICKYESEFFDSKYKIEIADLIIKDEYISVKIGNAQSLSYCVDQSDLSAKLINAGKIDLKKENLQIPEKYGLWFFMETNNVFDGDKINIEKIGSIMLLSKISTWSKNIKSIGKIPIIHINRYYK